MNLIDILILGFILFGALHGYQRGLVTSIVNFIGSIVGFLVAYWEYAKVLAWLLRYFPLQKWLEPVIYRTILPIIQTQYPALQHQVLGSVLGSLPEKWRSILNFDNLSSGKMPQTITQVANSLSGQITESILSFAAFGLVFLLVLFIIQILLSFFLRSFLGWGGAINRGGGLVLGGLCALITLAIFAGFYSPFLKLGMGGSVNNLIQKAYFYPYLLNIFNSIDRIFSAQLSQRLLEPLSVGKVLF